jgi:hypothetical protein
VYLLDPPLPKSWVRPGTHITYACVRYTIWYALNLSPGHGKRNQRQCRTVHTGIEYLDAFGLSTQQVAVNILRGAGDERLTNLLESNLCNGDTIIAAGSQAEGVGIMIAHSSIKCGCDVLRVDNTYTVHDGQVQPIPTSKPRWRGSIE